MAQSNPKTPNPKPMGLSRLHSPVPSSTQTCDWSWCWFTTESLQPKFCYILDPISTVSGWVSKTLPNITTSVISENYYGKWFGFCNLMLLSICCFQ
jgi:hypothetical protein